MATLIDDGVPDSLRAHFRAEVKAETLRASIDAARRSLLLAAGDLAPDLPIGSPRIGYYNRRSHSWSPPGSPRPHD